MGNWIPGVSGLGPSDVVNFPGNVAETAKGVASTGVDSSKQGVTSVGNQFDASSGGGFADIAQNQVEQTATNTLPGWLQWLLSNPKALITVVAGLVFLQVAGPGLELAANATEGES